MGPDKQEHRQTRAFISQAQSQTSVHPHSKVSLSLTLISSLAFCLLFLFFQFLFFLFPAHSAILLRPPSFPVQISARAASFTDRQAAAAVIRAASELNCVVWQGQPSVIAPQIAVGDLPP